MQAPPEAFGVQAGLGRVQPRDVLRAREQKGPRKYRYISVYVPTFAFDQLNDDKLDATQLVLAPQAGPCNAELCRVVLAMKDEIDNPGPMGTLYRDTLGLQVLIHGTLYRLFDRSTTEGRLAAVAPPTCFRNVGD
jgi:hypothetical protein